MIQVEVPLHLENQRLTFSKRRRVAYHETDPMLVVHHSKYLLWMEDMRFQIAQELLDLNYSTLTASDHYFFGVRKANVEYLSSCRYEDEVRISVWVSHPHEAMLYFYYLIERRRDPQLVDPTAENPWERAIMAEISNVVISASTWQVVDKLPPYLDQAITSAKEKYPWAFFFEQDGIENLTQFRRKLSTKSFRNLKQIE